MVNNYHNISFLRYEKAEFQAKVRQNYEQLYDSSYWQTVITDGHTLDEASEIFNCHS